jgi:uncharacterized protein
MIADRKKSMMVFSVLIFWCMATLICGCNADQNSKDGLPVETVQIEGVIFNLELALNPEQRAEGLMGRDKIADDGGMLFVFPGEKPYPTELSFWMKNCLVPIDLLFLDSAGKIIAIHEMEPPDSDTPDNQLSVYQSGAPAQFAIEIKGGLASELDLQVGDLIELRFTELLRLAE